MNSSDAVSSEVSTILIVDDTRTNLSVIGGILSSEYRVRVANSGERALKVAATVPKPDLILLDIMMPGMDGYQTISLLRKNPATRNIPVIFVTAMTSDEDEEIGLQLGAVDYITKPIRPSILLARVRTHLALKAAQSELASMNQQLEAQVRQRTRDLELVKDVSMQALATLAEKRDQETGNHLVRTRSYIELLMQDLCRQPRFAQQLRLVDQEMIAKAAALHDIGKVGIPDHILLKPGKLTPDEFAIMKTHAQIGADALSAAIERVLAARHEGNAHDSGHYALTFLEVAREIAGSHHEKWDGSGYPHGLAGASIPLSARLMALADVFDALTCRRPYKAAVPLDETIEIIRRGRGSHFDPDIVDAFLARIEDFATVAHRYADTGHPEYIASQVPSNESVR
ncbi:two-component system response regulator [Zoogloea sp.]|uniref:response regulator n=1 Tax=Zoogloea sp. TaxID=49181 RepID=UPI0035B32507